MIIWSVTAFALFMLFVCNIVFAILFCCITKKDAASQNWREFYKKTKCFIQFFGIVFSFKFKRLFYSRFFGLDNFSANFSNLRRFLNFFAIITIFNILFCLLPIIIVDIYGLITLSWGTQLYITLIETLVLSLIMFFFSLLELCCSRRLLKDYNKIDG